MPSQDVIREGERIMTICNACRYCEGFCAVFPAMERRRTFAEADLNYLANLCHNCTECLHACQYAPPHPFAVNVPKTLAEIRLRSYERYSWPRPLAFAFRRHGVPTVFAVAGVLAACMLVALRVARQPLLADEHADFYGVVPHDAMVAMFGLIFVFAVAAMVVGVVRFLNETHGAAGAATLPQILAGLRDALSLRYLHGSGESCTIRENARTPWRRWFHHATFYGFALCFASTSVAAVYHTMLNWKAPYPLLSAPVLLGTVGGLGLVVGPIGLWVLRARRDPATIDSAQDGLDRGFIAVLVATSITGLLLLAFRESAAMPTLLVVHLAFVLTCFVTFPYGKFVHGVYRAAALVRYAQESRASASGRSATAA